MRGHALHGDGDLHEFKTLVATLEDGRIVEVVVGADGHLEIIRQVGRVADSQGQAVGPGTLDVQAGNALGNPLPPDPSNDPDGVMDISGIFQHSPGVSVQELAELVRQGKLTLDRAEQILDGERKQTKPMPYGASTQPTPATEPGKGMNPTGQDQVVAALQPSRKPKPLAAPAATAYSHPKRKSWSELQGKLSKKVIADESYSNRKWHQERIGQSEPYVIERDPAFMAKLNNIMNDNQFDRRLRGRTRGKLDLTRLYKAETGSQSVFAQKLQRRNKNYNVALVIDQSGSMFTNGTDVGYRKVYDDNTPIGLVGTIAQFLAQHFDKIPGMDLMVTGFGSNFMDHKRFGETSELNHIRSRVTGWGGGGTVPYPALKHTYEQLARLDKGTNIVLFLTDGEVSDPGAVKTLIKHYDGVATTISIGIGVPNSLADHNFMVKTLPQLKPRILETLSKEIKRG